MSEHISASKGAIADKVLLPGDPLRAKFIAENFLENPVCYNEVRGMFGFTGTYKGVKVSVQGTGMGMPSIGIYAHELFDFYGVQKAIRIGTIGSIQEEVKVRDTIIANVACSDSYMLNQRFGGLHYAPAADFDLLYTAYNKSKELGIKTFVGPVVSQDRFYGKSEDMKLWKDYGVLGLEMESAELFTLAAEFKRKALAMFTVSNHLISGESTTPEERQLTFKDMMVLALESIIVE